MYIIGVDIGGTFTDVAVLDTDTSRTVTAKSLSTTANLSQGVFQGLAVAAEELGTGVDALLRETIKFVHATTLTSNVVFTFTGARVGLLTTRGFEDQILIMRGIGRVAGLTLAERRHPRTTSKPPLIVDETRIRGMRERIDWQGEVVARLDEEDARRCIAELLAEDVEALAISLLWSFMNPAHEQRLAEIAREMAPGIYLSLSSQVAPIRGEYERTATTVMNAYVGPTLERYLSGLDADLKQHGLRRPLLIVQSNGGITHVDQVIPVQTIESGPAVGVAAAQSVAQTLGHDRVIATDVGGTTFKVSLVSDGKWATSRETVIGQYGLRLPMVDVVSIGAGGGSIAWVDDVRLRVGPQSAQADPGPAAYGRGGTEPTVTDADLLLGYLNPDYFWGGHLRLDVEAARTAVRARVAEPLFDGDVERAAVAVRQIMDHQMADLIRKTTIERGYDPRDFVLLAYGGMGPVHCCSYAREVGLARLVVPTGASVLSALGACRSDILHSPVTSDMMLLPVPPDRVVGVYRRLEAEAGAMLDAEGIAPDRRSFARWVDMRYRRQMHEVRVDVPTGDLDAATIPQIADRFEQRYAALYGPEAAYREAGIEMVTFGVDARGLMDAPPLEQLPPGGRDPVGALKGPRVMYCTRRAEWAEGRVLDGMALRPGNVIDGLAVVEYPNTTVVVEHGSLAVVDAYGNIAIDLEV